MNTLSREQVEGIGRHLREENLAGVAGKIVATDAALRAQLTTAQNELCTAKDQIPPDMDGDSLSVALIKLKDARAAMTQELNVANRDGAHWFQVARNHEDTIAALQQRVKELEAALKAIQGIQMQWPRGKEGA